MPEYFTKNIFFSEDFKETLAIFRSMIKIDKSLLEGVLPSKLNIMKKNGLESHAIRVLITRYVEDNKDEFLKFKNKKTKDTDDKIPAN
jgi:hypothetical protein